VAGISLGAKPFAERPSYWPAVTGPWKKNRTLAGAVKQESMTNIAMLPAAHDMLMTPREH
jgi:hypothetical protein